MSNVMVSPEMTDVSAKEQTIWMGNTLRNHITKIYVLQTWALK